MNRFEKNLLESKSLEKKAARLAKAAKLAQEQIINELERRKSTLELQLDDLYAPTNENVKVEEVLTKIQDVREQLFSVERKLEIAKGTYSDLFEELPV